MKRASSDALSALPEFSDSPPRRFAIRLAKCARMEDDQGIGDTFLVNTSNPRNTNNSIVDLESKLSQAIGMVEKQSEQIQMLKHSMNEMSDTLLVMRRHLGIADDHSSNGDSGPASTQHTPKDQRVRTRVPDAPDRASRLSLHRRLHRE